MCIFVSDFGGLVGVAETLKALVRKRHTLTQAVCPIVLIVTENAIVPPQAHTDLIATQLLLEILRRDFGGEVLAYSSRLTVLYILPNKHQY